MNSFQRYDRKFVRLQLMKGIAVLGVLGNSAMSFAGGILVDGMDCGRLAELENAYGPFDYTNRQHVSNNLSVVEAHHFTPEIQALSTTDTHLNNNLDYTLRAFPNHHLALYALAKLRLRQESKPHSGYPVDCYFERALRFKPDDAGVYTVYGIYLFRKGRFDESVAKLRRAVDIAPKYAEAHYNLGLALYETGQLVEAAEHAAEAERLKYPLTGLVRKLQEADAWHRRDADE